MELLVKKDKLLYSFLKNDFYQYDDNNNDITCDIKCKPKVQILCDQLIEAKFMEEFYLPIWSSDDLSLSDDKQDII